jgi:NTE family protein
MNYQKPKTMSKSSKSTRQRPPFECIALVLQGGGALGSYQAGVYEAMTEVDVHPDWVAGISIGAINAAIIAGNAPEERVSKLKTFWETVSTNPLLDWAAMADYLAPQGDMARSFFNQMSAGFVLTSGANDFFTPRHPAPYFQPDGTVGATSYYDTSNLRSTLERLVDFDRINKGGMRLSVGAVNVRTGNFAYFDTENMTIRPEHIIASGSLPPGFPATEVDGELYWDGGLVSNTPLQWVVDGETRLNTLALQIDLWPAVGNVPRNLLDVLMRQKEIQYSSRTRAGTNQFKRKQQLRGALADLLANLPKDMQDNENAVLLKQVADHKVYNIVHLIYRSRQYEGQSKDFDFSRLAMNEHWQSGLADARFSLKHGEIFVPPTPQEGVKTFDFLQEEEDRIKKGA